MNERGRRVAPSTVSGLVRADFIGGPLGGRNVTVGFQPGGVIVDESDGRYLWGSGTQRGKLIWKEVANVPPDVPAIVLDVVLLNPPEARPSMMDHVFDELSWVTVIFGMGVAVASAIGIVYLIMKLVT